MKFGTIAVKYGASCSRNARLSKGFLLRCTITHAPEDIYIQTLGVTSKVSRIRESNRHINYDSDTLPYIG